MYYSTLSKGFGNYYTGSPNDKFCEIKFHLEPTDGVSIEILDEKNNTLVQSSLNEDDIETLQIFLQKCRGFYNKAKEQNHIFLLDRE